MTEEEIVALVKVSGLNISWEEEENFGYNADAIWGCSIGGDTIPHECIDRYAATREKATQDAWAAYLKLLEYQGGS